MTNSAKSQITRAQIVLAILALASVVVIGLDQYQSRAYKAWKAEYCATPADGHFAFKLACVVQPAESQQRI
ncbi:hypothetical protein ACXM5X_32335 [Pseudomonas saponiphila]